MLVLGDALEELRRVVVFPKVSDAGDSIDGLKVRPVECAGKYCPTKPPTGPPGLMLTYMSYMSSWRLPSSSMYGIRTMFGHSY